jgi:hypothetical protein
VVRGRRTSISAFASEGMAPWNQRIPEYLLRGICICLAASHSHSHMQLSETKPVSHLQHASVRQTKTIKRTAVPQSRFAASPNLISSLIRNVLEGSDPCRDWWELRPADTSSPDAIQQPVPSTPTSPFPTQKSMGMFEMPATN